VTVSVEPERAQQAVAPDVRVDGPEAFTVREVRRAPAPPLAARTPQPSATAAALPAISASPIPLRALARRPCPVSDQPQLGPRDDGSLYRPKGSFESAMTPIVIFGA
jgi:hypothetical protein